jgi:iron complex outermembrane receptor protein
MGARIESAKIDAQEFAAAGLPADSVSFTPYAAALGAFYTINKEWGVGANVQYTQRAPSSQELFADGPHVATDQFEVGDRALGKAKSTSIDLALKQQGEFFTSSVGAFYTTFSNFIGLFPTGIFRNPEDRSVAPGPEPFIDPDTGEEITPMQQFNYGQVKARFYGFEAQVGFPVWREGANLVTMKLQADYVNATDRDSDQPLPFIPPLRFGASFTYERDGLTATLGALFASSQDRVAQFQTTTPGYTNLYLNASYRWLFTPGTELEVFVQGMNLLDDTIRYSTSSLKDIAPAGARAVMAGVRGTF